LYYGMPAVYAQKCRMKNGDNGEAKQRQIEKAIIAELLRENTDD